MNLAGVLVTVARWIVLLGCVLLAAAFVCAAGLPAPFRSRLPRVAAAAAPHRELLLASAIALVLGVIVGVAIG